MQHDHADREARGAGEHQSHGQGDERQRRKQEACAYVAEEGRPEDCGRQQQIMPALAETQRQ